MNKNYIYLLFLLFFFFAGSTVYAELSVSLKVQAGYSITVDTENFPSLEAEITVKKDGVIYPVTEKNILIYEYQLDGATPYEVSPIESGVQTVKWYPKNSFYDTPYYMAQLVVTVEGESASPSAPLFGDYRTGLIIKITDEDSRELRECDWREIRPVIEPNIGNKIPIRLNMEFVHIDPENFGNIKIDSIKIEGSDDFTIEKLGADWHEDEFPDPPCELKPDRKYFIRVAFAPTVWEAQSANLLIYYEGGLEKRIPLYGNKTNYEKETVLRLISPNGGEEFTPCIEVDIVWENHAKNTPVKIYYSSNGLKEWKYIDQVTKDSVYTWTVPSDISDNVNIRIVQDMAETAVYNMSLLSNGLVGGAFNDDGIKATVADESGNVGLIDLYPDGGGAPEVTDTWSLRDENTENGDVFAVDFAGPDTVIAGINNPGVFGMPPYVTLAYYTPGEVSAFKTINLNDVISAKKMVADRKNNFLVLIDRKYSPVLEFRNLKTGEVMKTITFDAPIIDFVKNDKLSKALAATLDGMLYEISLPGFEIQNTIDNSAENLPIKIGYSSNGKLLSLGFANQGGPTDNFLYDIESRSVVLPIRPSSSNPVVHRFSPDNRLFILGSKYTPQISFTDLSNTDNTYQIDGHTPGELTDLDFSPDAHSLISTSGVYKNNFSFRTFSFPDFDYSDSKFRIVPVALELPPRDIGTVYMGTKHDIAVDDVRNIGPNPVHYYDLRFADGSHFEIVEGNALEDTLVPGVPAKFAIEFFPTEHGTIIDTLRFTICGVDYDIELKSEVLPRDISFSTEEFDFGEVCLNQEERYENFIISNNDPAPLIINSVLTLGAESKYFWNQPADTILPANSSLRIWIAFNPKELGKTGCSLTVFHSNRSPINSSTANKDTTALVGTGIGTYVSVSHNQLLFIPEIDTREMTIVNTGETAVVFENISTEPEGFFEILTNLPQTIAGGDTLLLSVRQIKEIDERVDMIVDAEPCLVQSLITIGNYEARANITVPIVEVTATEPVSLPVRFSTVETAGKYSGIRFFEGDFKVNSRLFIPVEVESEYGPASILEDKVFNGTRTFTVRVEGDFAGEGTLVNIKGYPGMADVNTTNIDISAKSPKFGTAVETSVLSGELTVLRKHDRKIFRPDEIVSIQAVRPNPANEYTEIVFESSREGKGGIDIVAADGTCVSSTDVPDINIGENNRRIITSGIAPGSYKIHLYTETGSSFANLVIVR